jgi:hypothetical protein
MEHVAYASVKGVPTADPHDQDRLGFNVWRWLMFRKDSLEEAVRSAGARILIPEQEALSKIREVLSQQGIQP